MSIETRIHQLEDRTYAIMPPVPTVAMLLVNRVAVLLGPLLSTLSVDIKDGGWTKFATALQGLDPEKTQSLLMDSVKAARLCVNNESIFEPMMFNKHFSNYRQEVYEVSLWVTWECVKDFFPNLEGLKGTVLSAIQKVSPFPPAGQGTSGLADQSGPGTAPGQT